METHLREQVKVRDQVKVRGAALADDLVLVLEKALETQVVGQAQPEEFLVEIAAMVKQVDIG